MARLIFGFTIVFLLSWQICKGQAPDDSVTYWVNQNYFNCIDSGNAVCNCQQQNNFLILYVDTILNKLTIHPSIYYSWEDIVSDIKKYKPNCYTISELYGIDSGSVLIFTGNQLTISNAKQKTVFIKTRLKRIDKWLEGDLWKQLGVINCKPLLKYSLSSCNDSSKIILTQKELASYISKGEITIDCSDDYHYNEMQVKNSATEFFMVYEADTITIYKMPERGRGETVDVTKLKECQVYHKLK